MTAQLSNRATILSTIYTQLAAISGIGTIYREPPPIMSDADLIAMFYNSTIDTLNGGWISIQDAAEDVVFTIGQHGSNQRTLTISVAYFYGAARNPASPSGTGSRARFEANVEAIAQVLRQRPAVLFASAGITPTPQWAPGGMVSIEHVGPARMDGAPVVVHSAVLKVKFLEWLTRE